MSTTMTEEMHRSKATMCSVSHLLRPSTVRSVLMSTRCVYKYCFCFWSNVVFKHLKSYRDGGTLTMCCQTGMQCRRHRTVYRHWADLLLCLPLMWKVTHENTTTYFNVLGQNRSRDPSPTFHTHQRTLNFLMLIWWWSVRSSVESVPSKPGTCSV